MRYIQISTILIISFVCLFVWFIFITAGPILMELLLLPVTAHTKSPVFTGDFLASCLHYFYLKKIKLRCIFLHVPLLKNWYVVFNKHRLYYWGYLDYIAYKIRDLLTNKQFGLLLQNTSTFNTKDIHFAVHPSICKLLILSSNNHCSCQHEISELYWVNLTPSVRRRVGRWAVLRVTLNGTEKCKFAWNAPQTIVVHILYL